MSTMRAFCGGKNVKKDKGYAWVVLVLAVISHSLHIGFTPAITGNLTIVHQSVFGMDLQLSGLISTVHIATTFLFGPVASLLVKKLGCRITAIFGGTCLVLGLGLSSLSTQPWHAFLLFGLLAGIGIPSLLVSTSEILSMHFSKYKYLAFSVVILGQFIGTAVWPVVSQLLLDNYGYHKTMLVLASFQFVNIAVGSFLVEPSRTDSELADVEATQESLRESFRTLLVSFPVWMLLLNSLCWGGNVNSFFVFVNDFIVHKLEVTKDEAALGITIIGIASLCGTLAVVSISSQKFDRAILHACCLMLFGISSIVIAFSVNMAMFHAVCAVWGLGLGGCIANLLAFISGFCKVDHLALLFGLVLMVEGMAAVTVAALVGYITTQVGAEYGIILSGCFGIVGALCILPVVVRRARDKRHNKEDNSLE